MQGSEQAAAEKAAAEKAAAEKAAAEEAAADEEAAAEKAAAEKAAADEEAAMHQEMLNRQQQRERDLASQIAVCENCEEACADLYCMKCECWLCDDCAKTTHASKIFARHTLIAASERIRALVVEEQQ